MSNKFVLAIALLLAAGLFQPTFACSCMKSGPPCEAWGNADGVFLGRAVAIRAVERRVVEDFIGTITRTSLHVRFEVESAFRGVEGRTVEIETDGGSGGGCGYPFQMGGRYVVYAHKGSGNVLSTSICSRTRRAENAAEDLSFLSGVGTAPPLARIFGQLEFREDVPLLSKPRTGPLAGAQVVVEGTGRSWEAHSDAAGRYEISGLPAGTYKVRPQMGPGSLARFYPPSKDVKLVERGCAAADAYAQVHGRISGKLTDSNGAPMPDRSLQIMPEAMSPLEARSWELPYAITKEDGTYEFATLPSGRYVVGVNLFSPPQSYRPGEAVYPRTYFPSASERADAQVIELPAGMERRDVNIALPRPLQKREIRGTVLWSDGTRVKGAGVNLSSPQYAAVHNRFAQADDNGEFTFDGYEGLPYVVAASSANDPYGKPLRGRVSTSPTSIDRDRTVVTLPYPATLKGRLVDALGKPQADVEVELILDEARGWEAVRRSQVSMKARSDSQGLFELSGLSPQRYVLAIHASSPPLKYERYAYPPAFYPGTSERSQGEVIVIKEGQQAQLSDFVLPARLVPEVVRGIAVWPDGRPVQSGFFRVEDLDFPGWTDVASGAIAVDGRFEMSLFVGRRYLIQAVAQKDQEGRELLWLLETKPAEFVVDPKADDLKLRMPALPELGTDPSSR